MAGPFASKVGLFSEKAIAKETAVWHQSLRDLDADISRPKAAGGHIPVVRGNLRNSRTLSTLGPAPVDWRTKKFRDATDAMNNAIAGVELGQTVHISFRAPYAKKVEDKSAFLRLGAQNWTRIVDGNAAAAKAKG